MAAVHSSPYRIHFAEAKRLSDMTGVCADLITTIRLCDVILPRMGPESDSLELEALQAAAIVRYGRVFSGGVRTEFKITEELVRELLDDELLRAHQEFLDLRDKHIAHSVNDWEMNIPVAQVRTNTETQERSVENVYAQRHTVVALADHTIKQLQEVSRRIVRRVEDEIAKEQVKVLEIARAMPIEQLIKEGLEIGYPARGSVSERRTGIA